MMGGIGGFALGGMMSGTWGPTAPTTQPTVTPDQAMQIAQQWLDQYRAGNATEAADMFPQNDLPRDREILLICPSGRRSAQAAQLLLSVGHSAVNVAGGMQAWTQASLPVSR